MTFDDWKIPDRYELKYITGVGSYGLFIIQFKVKFVWHMIIKLIKM